MKYTLTELLSSSSSSQWRHEVEQQQGKGEEENNEERGNIVEATQWKQVTVWSKGRTTLSVALQNHFQVLDEKSGRQQADKVKEEMVVVGFSGSLAVF